MFKKYKNGTKIGKLKIFWSPSGTTITLFWRKRKLLYWNAATGYWSF